MPLMNGSAAALAEVTPRRVRARTVLVVLAVLFGAGIYSYVVDIYDPNKNLLSQIWRGIRQHQYIFYSGASGGFYIEIGKALEANTSADASIAVDNDEESTGGLYNATKVMTTPNSFGLVQEDTLPKEDFIRDHIRYVTPLYLERLHIIYDHGAYTKVYQKMFGSSSDISPPSLGTSASVHKAVKTFFQQSKVSTGPVGSASRIFASYLRDVCEIGPFRDEGLHFAEALDSLMHEDDGIDIVFSMAGAPLVRVRGALQTREEDGGKDLRLMSIESALVPELNGRYGVKLRGSTFKDKYDGYDNTSTIGSYAFLVTSKDVPNLAVMELLRVFC